jgi:hypothetical protein
VTLISTEIFEQLTVHKQYKWFQQDSATAHTTDHSLAALEQEFGDRIISHSLWPACLPHHKPCDFHLWGNLIDKVYRMNPIPKKTRRKTYEEII